MRSNELRALEIADTVASAGARLLSLSYGNVNVKNTKISRVTDDGVFDEDALHERIKELLEAARR